MHDADELAEATATSELVIYLTPVTFGGYSSVLKTLVDRLIFLVLPFFMIVNGETHHVPRYEVRPNLLVVGTMPEAEPEQEATFIELAERNAINWSAEKHAAGVVLETEEPGAQAHRVKSLLGRVGVVS
jgi:multimeric flavodoxin WrbA